MAYVGESVTDPLAYYDNNTAGTISLLKAMHSAGVKRLVFSSTCATYGEPEGVPIVETMRQSPISPYGWSKWCVERILRDYSAANREFAFVAPRYFNVAGCAADGSLGEDHHPETHLIPVILQALLGQREKVVVFGTDYPTPDGTCIRDYIHVEDLCEAHIVAMNALQPGDARFYNLGIGRGYSVKEVIDSVQAGDRQEGAGGIRRPAARRPGRVVCQRPEDPRRAWLAGAAHGDRRLSWPRPGIGSRIIRTGMRANPIIRRRVGGARKSCIDGALREPVKNSVECFQGFGSVRNPPCPQRFASRTLQFTRNTAYCFGPMQYRYFGVRTNKCPLATAMVERIGPLSAELMGLGTPLGANSALVPALHREAGKDLELVAGRRARRPCPLRRCSRSSRRPRSARR